MLWICSLMLLKPMATIYETNMFYDPMLQEHRVVTNVFTAIFLIYTPFTQGLRPLCLPCATTKLARSPLKAQRRPKGCLGGSRVAQRTFRPCHGCRGRREVLSMLETVAQRSPRRSVVHRSLKVGSKNTYASPWSQNGCTGWSLVAP